jgi:hypothetical protein
MPFRAAVRAPFLDRTPILKRQDLRREHRISRCRPADIPAGAGLPARRTRFPLRCCRLDSMPERFRPLPARFRTHPRESPVEKHSGSPEIPVGRNLPERRDQSSAALIRLFAGAVAAPGPRSRAASVERRGAARLRRRRLSGSSRHSALSGSLSGAHLTFSLAREIAVAASKIAGVGR